MWVDDAFEILIHMLLKLILAFSQSFHNPFTPFFVEDFEVLLIILVVPTLEF